ncbi:2-dehydro-3-deoxyphosphogluconate aldolase / (4S)-4-hydroxy-2-oxoglutarate aldolase [Paenibacillus sophorae]|uniref:2-dehydro-3-deoxyphosphogluconate aldolase / (4S)-4-hydroxy-2-oxoglutarate aldolase n=1 Tax=Paenibacillus sophorae TaxID=1333845 RepID=A0A1H8IW68_9BACL|nr:bifunctional 4-hydroxy-2-oxoglutarate aldolase/2-dehydro-3-deoxy-phosphogluconate aldolase [Paenibacillus sophorae]QWU16108.1 bifunctional 4-hydroxy-2-oxoglutarate aldolase/2-dehydro-3-deoxy-phosphogluconate aldolase [Paenibacillus sophorae]SEN72824.1 2-dehydro-3-deoxyphosphogluconate aldolase / (4S)-4-hydroxy-2-oxoglutarate aldolase [Paenibacillus sophorae]
MEKWKVIRTIEETGIIAIVRGTKPQEMMRIASALYNGGVKVIEVTCNTPGYLGMIEQLAGEMGEKMIIGAGTVLNAATAQSVIDAGATFALAPDLNPEVIKALHEKNRLIIPGVATPTEMVQAQRLGVELMKLFPAGALGARFLKEVRGPLADIRFIPVGGINLGNIGEFAEAGAVAFGIGGELVNKSLIDSGNYSELTNRAESFIETVRRHKHS